MLKIGDFSKLSRISVKMLRHYDEIGLLTPRKTDPFTGYRYYGENQLPVAGRINALKDMGFGLATIREICACCDDPQALARYLSIKQSELQEQAEEAARRLRLLETAICRLRKDENTMHYDVTLKTVPQRYVISVRDVIPAYDQEYRLWQTMNEETADQKPQMDEPSYSLAVFYDEGYKETDADVEVQCAVKGTYRDTAHVRFKTVPPVLVASATFKGGYERLMEANQAVAQWVSDNGYQFNGPMFCIYHVSPAQTSDPEELVTEVCYPVGKNHNPQA